MTKTIVQRVLEVTLRNSVFNRNIAKRAFRNRNSEALHNSVLRTARRLNADGYLRRIDIGEYSITKTGLDKMSG